MYQDATENSPNNSLIQDLDDNKNIDSTCKEGQKLSGTYSTESENKNYYCTPQMYENCPMVQNIEKGIVLNTKKILHTHPKKFQKYKQKISNTL